MNSTTKTRIIQRAHDALIGGLHKYMHAGQRYALGTSMMGEEAEGIAEIILRMLTVIETAPVTYQQEGKGDDAVAHLHYFMGGIDAWVTELDMDGGVTQAFGLQCIDGIIEHAELGYISITELISAGAELDLHFTPKTLADIKAKR